MDEKYLNTKGEYEPNLISDDDLVRQDFTGAISGFDLGIGVSDQHVEGFDPSILASGLEFGAGAPVRSREWRAEYLERHGREDEAYERDE